MSTSGTVLRPLYILAGVCQTIFLHYYLGWLNLCNSRLNDLISMCAVHVAFIDKVRPMKLLISRLLLCQCAALFIVSSVACEGSFDSSDSDVSAWDLAGDPSDTRAPSRYEMRDGMPVAEHVGSFVYIAHDYNQACVIDEFGQLLCWSLETRTSPASELEFIEPIATNVREVVLDGASLCIIQDEPAGRLSCLNGEGLFEQVFPVDAPGRMSASIMYSTLVCALDMGRLECATVLPTESNDSFLVEPVELPGRQETLYHSFRLSDHSIARVESQCALDAQRQVRCWTGFGTIFTADSLIMASASQGIIDDMRYSLFGMVAIRVGQTIELLDIDPWDYTPGPYTPIGLVPGQYSALYSGNCAQSVEGPVVCWDQERVLWTLLEQQPRALSVGRSSVCAITTEGSVFCQDRPR